MLGRALRWIALALVIVLAAAYGAINLSGHDPDRWHVDPAAIELRGTPNEFLAAPEGTTQAVPDMETPIYPDRPEALLARFDDVARAQPDTQRVAGDVDSGMITYVQRTPVIGFPDYVTVKVVPVENGAGLIVYSRSRFGEDDWGVNRQRVRTWLGELGPPEDAGEAGGQAGDEPGESGAEEDGGDAATEAAE